MAAAGATGPSPGGAPSPSVPLFGNAPLPPSRALAASAFLAGDEPLTIVPSFNLQEPLSLLSGDVGPFRAGVDAVVPLWMATTLRRRRLARIVPPPWMDAEVLREVLRFERDPLEKSFSPDLPFRHAEVARAVLAACRAGSGTGAGGAGDGAESEVPDAERVRLLLADIASVRADKIRKNVHQLSRNTLRRGGGRGAAESVIEVTGIGSLEMHAIQPFVAEAFRLSRELSGRGSTYARDAGPDAARPAGGGGGASAGRGRLQRSRLARENANAEEEEEEGLMEPRPMEEMEGQMREGDEASGEADANAGRSSLRPHRR